MAQEPNEGQEGQEGQYEGAVTNINLENHLKNYKFSQYDKIKDDIDNGDLTIDELLDCSINDLTSICTEKGITTIQRKRFIKAISELPNANSNQPETPVNNNNAPQAVIILSSEDQTKIDELTKKEKIICQYIEQINHLKEMNKQTIKNATNQINNVFNDFKQYINELHQQCLDQLKNEEESEEKSLETNLLQVVNYGENLTKIRKLFVSYLLSKDKPNPSEDRKMMEKVENEQKLFPEMVSIVFNKLKIENMIENITEIQNKIKENAFFNFNVEHNQCTLFMPIKWRLSICGLSNKIINNGQTFDSGGDCLARTDQAMKCDNGIFKIKWKINKISSTYNVFGLCTDYYTQGSSNAQSWLKSDYYVGWNNNSGLLDGWGRKDNIFHIECKFEGDKLPKIEINDEISLIYDSFNNILLFEKNEKLLNSRLINIPNNLKLFWCIAKWNSPVIANIIDE